MTTGEHKDWQTRHLLDEQSETYREFQEALDKLRAIADDFDDGSQQRFMLQMREVSALRDDIWSLQRQLDEIGREAAT